MENIREKLLKFKTTSSLKESIELFKLIQNTDWLNKSFDRYLCAFDEIYRNILTRKDKRFTQKDYDAFINEKYPNWENEIYQLEYAVKSSNSLKEIFHMYTSMSSRHVLFLERIPKEIYMLFINILNGQDQRFTKVEVDNFLSERNLK